MSTILITGATGTIGALTARALLGAGQIVRLGVRSPDKASLPGARAVRFDFDDPASMTAALQGVDRLLLITPFVEDHAPMVARALDAARAAGVSFVLRLSAAGADPTATEGLPAKHGLGERLLHESGLGWAVLRPNFFVDNLWKFAADGIRSQGALFGAAGEGRTAYVAGSDIAAVAAAILAAPDAHLGRTYTLTGPEALSEPELAALVSGAIGREVRYIDLPPDALRQGMAGAPDWMIDDMLALEAVKANGWAQAISPDVEAILGRPPASAASAIAENAARLA
ncbi:MAG: NAD(P)H-binding protein [Alphaproteobacteria bacterium]|nr:NAD(P)H-binding protein [Alphaproteobacteria bacterium]